MDRSGRGDDRPAAAAARAGFCDLPHVSRGGRGDPVDGDSRRAGDWGGGGDGGRAGGARGSRLRGGLRNAGGDAPDRGEPVLGDWTDAAGKKIEVLADETRPFLQGARLTAWELQHDGIPVKLITDNMAGYFLHSGRVGCVVVGADRIAANGDVANKIGTYSLAVLAKENGVDFYVAAPLSTLDLRTASGAEIPIEQRAASEVTHVFGVPVAPENVGAENPAFV